MTPPPAPLPGARINWFTYWRGRWRLRWGLCPLCNSSPPRKGCLVCEGSYAYSPRLPAELRLAWRHNLETLREAR